MKEMKREKHASYSSHNSCKSLSEELRDYYEGRHRAHPRPHFHGREKERKPEEANINLLLYFNGKDNVEANLDWEIRVKQQLKKNPTHSPLRSINRRHGHQQPNRSHLRYPLPSPLLLLTLLQVSTFNFKDLIFLLSLPILFCKTRNTEQHEKR